MKATRIPEVADKSVLVIGANRGIGRALVEEALRKGAKPVRQRFESAPRPYLQSQGSEFATLGKEEKRTPRNRQRNIEHKSRVSCPGNRVSFRRTKNQCCSTTRLR